MDGSGIFIFIQPRRPKNALSMFRTQEKESKGKTTKQFFSRFYNQKQGWGLGLSLAKGSSKNTITENLCKSSEINKGTTIRIVLKI